MPERPAPTMRTSKCSAAIAISPGRASRGALSRPVSQQASEKQQMKSPGSLRGPDIAETVNRGNERSIPIMIRLERTFLLHADIVRLVLAQFGQLDADLGEMQADDALTPRLRQPLDFLLFLSLLFF